MMVIKINPLMQVFNAIVVGANDVLTTYLPEFVLSWKYYVKKWMDS